VYYVMAASKISVVPMPQGLTDNYYVAGYPHPANFYRIFGKAIARYGPIAIPYAIMVNIGDMSVCAQAKIDGNNFNSAFVMMSDAFFTVLSGMFGGVIQTTLYIGHSTYHKSFKCRSFYSLAQGIFFGVGGLLGYISFLTQILPKPAILPIFIFIAFEIVSGTFHSPSIKIHHGPAVVFALFPGIAQVAQIILSQLYNGRLLDSIAHPAEVARDLGLSPSIVSTISSVLILAHGFINISLLWGSALGFIVDKRYKKASVILVLSAVLSFFGVIHSVDSNAGVYVPWQSESYLPYHWTGAYMLAAIITFVSEYSLQREVKIREDSSRDLINHSY